MQNTRLNDPPMTAAPETRLMLAPCPFCGKPPKYENNNSFHTICCMRRGCAIAEVCEDSFEEAAKRWNTRASEPAGAGIREALEEIVRKSNGCGYDALGLGKIAATALTLPSPPSPDAGVPAANPRLEKLQERRNELLNDFGNGAFQDGLTRDRLARVEKEIAALSPPSAGMEGRREEIALDALELAIGHISGMARAAGRAHVFGSYVDAYHGAESCLRQIADNIKTGAEVRDCNGLIWGPARSPGENEGD